MPYFRAQAVAASESAAVVTFTVTLDAPSVNEVRVNYSLVNGTAVWSGNSPDFRSQSGTLTFAPGQTQRSIDVQLVDNIVAEGTEVFWLDLTSPVGATIAQRYTPALIFDNDGAAGTPVIRASAPVVDERAGTADFLVWLSRPSTLPVSVGYTTVDETATAGQDFQTTTGLLSFAPGEMVKTVSVPLVNDAVAETQEHFRLQFSNPSNATLGETSVRATIGASDGAPVGAPYISAWPVSAQEGDTLLHFVVSLSAPSVNEVRVNFSLTNGTAVWSGNAPDFDSYSGTLVFAPGETTRTIPVILIDNATAEATETFWLDLGSPVNGIITQRYTPATVFDNDGTSGSPVLRVSHPVVDEAAGMAGFVVSLSRPSTVPVSVGYSTVDETATAGADYLARAGTLVFQPGEMVRTVWVDVLDDALAEPAEFFRLRLADPVNATLAEAEGRAEIGLSDGSVVGTPRVSARIAAAGEGDGSLGVVVSLSAPSPNEVRVNFSMSNGTAVWSGNAPDFLSYSGTLVFPPGQTTHVVPVLLVDNATAEATEVFWFELTSPVNAVVGQRYTPITLFDNDAPSGTPEVSVSDVVVNEGDGVAVFFVHLSRPSTTPVTVHVATADDTARAGNDYRATSGTLVFQPGEMVRTVLVDLFDDDLAETDEVFHLIVTSATGATLGDASGTALIGRNDGQTVSRPQVTAQPVVASEGDGRLDFIVQLSAPSHNEVRVNFSLTNGTAVWSGNSPDFSSYSGTLVFAPGQTTLAVPVLLVNDTVAEGDETFTLDLTSPVNATVPQRLTTATILDDDGAGTVQSRGLGNDRYLVTSALDRIAEGPGGGIDTVVASLSFTLPAHVENLVLTGTALNGLGNAGNNVFVGTPANNLFDGKEGIDTVVFSGPRANYTLNGTVASRTVSSTADGTDTLLSIERLQFRDVVLASDTTPGGHTYLAYAMLNAAFDAPPDLATLSLWTARLDRLGSLEALAQDMINTYAPGVPDEVLVTHLWGTVVGSPIPLDALSAYVGLVRDGTYTQAGLLALVTTLDLNTVEIVGIVGQTLMLDPAFFPIPG